ncbi:MAG: hypothetical protein IT584_00375 [Chlamydiae bacterium]|nr:hypothetical protein [Chlamydiota bacterium]
MNQQAITNIERSQRNKKLSFTLLEVMLGITLLLITGGVVFWKMETVIKKGRFSTDVSKIETELRSSHRLALNTGRDWKLEIISSESGLEICSGPIPSQLPPRRLKIGSLTFTFQDMEMERFCIYFSPTGKIEPEGVFSFSSPCGSFHKEISSFELFRQREIPEALGPSRPENKDEG